MCEILTWSRFQRQTKEEANSDINDPRVNPDMRRSLILALDDIPKDGIKFKSKNFMNGNKDISPFPQIVEIYRTPERSQLLESTGIIAAGADKSAHNYGVAVDISL